MNRPPVSMIICTRDRAVALRRCLEVIPAEEMCRVGVELVLVDNASTDETPEVLHTFAESADFPVHVIHEPTPGLSSARTAGLHATNGEIIAFTDDDCYLADGFLTTLIEVFARNEFDFCGGRILLYDPSDAMAAVNYLERRHTFRPEKAIIPGEIQGANMHFRRKVVEKIGDFDPFIGAGTPFRFGDIDYCARALVAGFVGAHV
ncbi:MAG: glycosyltransferase family A protein, partial [Phycisphaerae bacterium]